MPSARTFRFIGCILAALAFVTFAGSLKFSASRIYHQLTWDLHPLTVVEAGGECVLEIRQFNIWAVHSLSDCSTDALQDNFRASAESKTDGKRWRVLVKPTALVEHELPERKVERFAIKDDFFLPEPKPEGSQIWVLRNPQDPEAYDHTFDAREMNKTLVRLAVVSVSSLAIYFLWPGLPRPRSRQV